MSIQNINIQGTGTFRDTATNFGEIVDAVFAGSSTNAGSVTNVVVFEANAINTGTVQIAEFRGEAQNQGIVSLSASFADASVNTDAGLVPVAVFADSASNAGTVTTQATFQGTAVNTGTVQGDAVFADSASNAGTVSTATFQGSAVNTGTIQGDAVFADTTSNQGSVQGNAQVAETATNSGTVSGAVTEYVPPASEYIAGYKVEVINGQRTITGNVSFDNRGLSALPDFSGVVVTGYFTAIYNNFTNLIGSPYSVGGYFSVQFNQLTSIEGHPTYVNGYSFAEAAFSQGVAAINCNPTLNLINLINGRWVNMAGPGNAYITGIVFLNGKWYSLNAIGEGGYATGAYQGADDLWYQYDGEGGRLDTYATGTHMAEDNNYYTYNGTNGSRALAQGYISSVYYLDGLQTNLDQYGNNSFTDNGSNGGQYGTYNGKFYQNGGLYSGSMHYLQFADLSFDVPDGYGTHTETVLGVTTREGDITFVSGVETSNHGNNYNYTAPGVYTAVYF